MKKHITMAWLNYEAATPMMANRNRVDRDMARDAFFDGAKAALTVIKEPPGIDAMDYRDHLRGLLIELDDEVGFL